MIYTLTWCTLFWGSCFQRPIQIDFSSKSECVEARESMEKQARANGQKFNGWCAPKAKP
jgi:hypothetical protein